MFVDLTPDVALVCAVQADRQGNLYTGPNTEDTPTIVEATAFHDGVVVVQVNEIVDELPRVDIPASWVMDGAGNSSTVTQGRLAGFGGAPNMGSDARGRRHPSPAWLRAGREGRGNIVMPRGQKLVVQIV